MNEQNVKSLIGVLLAILIGTGIALAGSQGSAEVFGLPLFLLAVSGAYLIQWAVFIIAYLNKSEKFFDLTGGLTYITITTAAVLLSPLIDQRAVLLLVLVVVWATRLSTFLFTRVQKQGKDDRFDEIKVSFSRFLLTWTLQGLWVTFTAAAAFAAITRTTPRDLGWFALVGFIVWAFGFFFELIADVQKSAFKANPNNEGKFIHSGLWAWSRHPNYFGEIVLWIGVAIIALPVLQGWALVTLISPVWVILQLTLISGVPMLENKADKKWGGQEDYERYKRTTSVLIPRPPSIREKVIEPKK
jgi:steroid 5-alpha reductase family enzyme